MKKKEKAKVLKTQKRTIKFNCPIRGEVEQEIKVKVYEEQKYTRDDSLANEILGNSHQDED